MVKKSGSVDGSVRARDPCRRPEGSWALGTAMISLLSSSRRKNNLTAKRNMGTQGVQEFFFACVKSQG